MRRSGPGPAHDQLAAPVSLRLNDAPRYEEFYGFVHPPFTAAPDPRFFAPIGSHGRAIEVLGQAIRAHERVTLLTGAPGAGKTTVCRALVTQVDEAVLTSLVLEPVTSIEDLLRTVLQDFGVISSEGGRSDRVAAATRQQLTDALTGFLRSLEPIGGRCVVVIDEAHRLSPVVLQQLTAMTAEEMAESGRLQIVLSARPELLETLRESDVRELDRRISTRATLEPLSPDDVRAYVARRLSQAGADSASAPSFEPEALEAVHRHTGGVPLAINTLCDRALTLGAQLEVRNVAPEVIDEAARDLDLAPASSQRAGRSALPLWVKVGLPILLLLGLIAAWFSGAASTLFP